MSRSSRRDFLKRSAAAAGVAATFTIAGTKASGKVLGANDTVQLAVVGVGGRGRDHLRTYSWIKHVDIPCIVDVDSRVFQDRVQYGKYERLSMAKCYQDVRKMLDDKNIDAVSIATPHHWHTLVGVWACQAGKDVYIEKPCSHNIFEGRKLVEAARRYNRIVQHGTQSRTCVHWQLQCDAIRSGKYGKLLVACGYGNKPRGSIEIMEPKEPPEGLDFDLWLGPAPKQPYRDNIVPYNWHWYWDFGNGEIGNQGVHQLDIARWAMPAGSSPKSVVSLGGRFGYKDQGQTPNMQLSIFDYGDFKLLFEDYGLVDKDKVANEFYTDEGVMRDGVFYPKRKTEGERVAPPQIKNRFNDQAHMSNFIDCVRSRKREDLTAEILEGHKSSMLAHLANTSYRLGAKVPFSQETKALGDDKMAYESFAAMMDLLVGRAKLDLQEGTYQLGRTLHFDAQAEKYVGDDEANQLLARPYRAPYVVPETV